VSPATKQGAESRAPLIAPELMARVRQIQLRTHKLVNTALAGGYRSTFRGTGLEFAEVRPYLPGDDVRAIDWNVTARTGEPHIKTFAEERELTLDLLVDTSTSMDFGSRRWTKREAAAQLAALIAFVAMKHQDRVGLTLFGETTGLHLQPRKGTRHSLRVIREVIAAPSTPGASDLAGVLEHHLRAAHRRGMVFVISDFLGQPGSAAEAGESGYWGDFLRSLALRHDVICLRVFDPLEEALPSAGMLTVREIETGRWTEVDSRSPAVRRAWSEAARKRLVALDGVLNRARAERVDVSTGADLAEPLIAFFRRRIQRYGGRVR
jgi:uncharacterized protein (DUF58 family)